MLLLLKQLFIHVECLMMDTSHKRLQKSTNSVCTADACDVVGDFPYVFDAHICKISLLLLMCTA